MAKRKALSKKVRFEVFKRDRFTCQYCGAKAPEAVLHCDHIRPVADGGEDDILNLVTACAACNGGKGARKLDDRSAVERQRAQLEELQARREQLEMMLQWRDEAERHKVDVVEEIAERAAERGGFYPNENGKANIRRWLKRFSVAEILAALDEAFDHYMRYQGNDPIMEAWEVAFKKVPAIASLNAQAVDRPYLPRLAYIQGICRKRFRDPRGLYIEALERIHTIAGVPLEDMERIAKQAADWDEFCGFTEDAARALGWDGEGRQ